MNLTISGPVGAPPLVLSNALGTTAAAVGAAARGARAAATIGGSVTSTRSEGASVAELAEALLEALARVGMERVSFCGLSLGAMVGMWIAAGASGPDRPSDARMHVRALWRSVGVGGTSGVRAGARAWSKVARDALDKWFTPAYVRSPAVSSTCNWRLRPRSTRSGSRRSAGSTFASGSARSRSPTLVIAGAQDTATHAGRRDCARGRDPRIAARGSSTGAARLANVEAPRAFTLAVLEHLW